jgi:gliding motility-associated-like protein
MIYNTKKQLTYIILLLSLFISSKAGSQVCSGSLGSPLINITFGSGITNPGPQIPILIPGATTNYNFASYATGIPPSVIFDGDYGVVNQVPFNSAWYTGSADHTGNTNGYMAFFNSAPTPGEFYRQTVTGLCAGTTYEFSGWVANVINPSVLPSAILPNITFKILNPSNSAILASFNTGNIPMANSMTWKQYSFLFVTPATINSVILILENNNIGGNSEPGNDLALDDITFRPCGPTVIAAVNNTSICGGQSVNLSGNVFGNLNNPAFQWQISSNGGNSFSNIAGANTANYTLSGLTIGNYKIQLLASEAANINSIECRFISNVLDLTINPSPPVPTFSIIQPSCTNSTGSIIISPTGVDYEYSINGINYQQSNTFTSLQPNTYNVTIKNKVTGCLSVSLQAEINEIPPDPQRPIIANITQPNCLIPTGTVVIASPLGNNLMYSVNGTTYQAGTTITGLAPGTYNLTVQNSVSVCTSVPNVFVINDIPSPPAKPAVSVVMQPNCNIATGSMIVSSPLNSNYQYSINGSTYQNVNNFSGLLPGTYIVTAKDRASGCISDTSQIKIETDINLGGQYFIPNAFTPNNDGINDCFKITNWGLITELKFMIFNRWGQMVFSANNPNLCWDGNFNGLPAVPDTYVYFIKATSLCGVIERKGNLALIR